MLTLDVTAANLALADHVIQRHIDVLIAGIDLPEICLERMLFAEIFWAIEALHDQVELLAFLHWHT